MFSFDSTAIKTLMQEIYSYLHAVDLFRSEGSEPRWLDLPPSEQPLAHQAV